MSIYWASTVHSVHPGFYGSSRNRQRHPWQRELWLQKAGSSQPCHSSPRQANIITSASNYTSGVNIDQALGLTMFPPGALRVEQSRPDIPTQKTCACQKSVEGTLQWWGRGGHGVHTSRSHSVNVHPSKFMHYNRKASEDGTFRRWLAQKESQKESVSYKRTWMVPYRQL